MGMTYPLRYVNVAGGAIASMDFTSEQSQDGIALRLLECSNIDVQDMVLRDRGIALQITGGSGYQVNSCDMTLSGQDEDYSVMLLKQLEMNRPEHLNISGLTYDSDAPTVVNMIDCRGIHIADQLSDSPGVELSGQMSGSAAIRLQGGGVITIRGLQSTRDISETGTQAILAQNGVDGLIVEECRLNGFSTGVNLESVQGVGLHCNSLELNDNGLHLSSDSELISCSENSFRCNAIAIHNDSSNPVVSLDDYWGHPEGSSSFSGLGDYYIGMVDASVWSDSIPNCISSDSIPGCGFEICDNGIDDDGDGVIDCEDGSCLDEPHCQGLTPRSSRGEEHPLLGAVIPNPNDGRFRVELGSEATHMFLLDTSGRIVRSLQLRSFEDYVEWDVGGMAPGLYRLVVTSGSERSSTSVLIR